MKPFIQDNERVLNTSNDLLKTSVYAENLVKVIENTPKDKVFTIGVFGGWGTGKSSIIRTAQDAIERKNNKDKKVKFITYDAWKYANDSFRRMFLLKVQQELKLYQTPEMQRFYQSEFAEAEPKTKVSTRGLVIVCFVLLLVLFILNAFTQIEIGKKITITSLITFLTFIIALINGCFYDLKLTINKPALFAPEQFEACFKQMMSKCLVKNNWFKTQWLNAIEFVTADETSVKNLDKLIIVIDNIDRCHSDMAYQLLTDIKTFLSDTEYNLVFIVPVDDEALKKHLFRKWSKNGPDDQDINKEKEEFLRKFFNITMRIKPHQEMELQHFAHEIDKENELGFSNDTLAIVSKEFADNPRRIIQLLNNLSSELTLYDDEFVTKYETVICSTLILREDYSDFYKKATRNLDMIRAYNDGDNEGLNSFMRITGVIFKKTPIDVLLRIFTNTSSIFCDLSPDIQQCVRTYDSVKVVEFAKKNEALRTNLIDYTLEKLTTDVKYGVTTQTTQWMDFLCKLYKKEVFDATRFKAIDEQLSAFYDTIVSNTSDTDSLCYMGYSMYSKGFEKLRNYIVTYLNAENAKKESNFERILDGYITYFTGQNDCDAISSVFEDYYADKVINKEHSYTGIQIKTLFNDSFVLKQIENVGSMEEDDRVEDIVWCINTNKELSGSTFLSLFNKYVELFGVTRGKTKENYLEFISQTQSTLGAIETGALEYEPSSLYNVIIQNRGIPNPTYRNQPQYDNHLSILDEVNEGEAKIVTAFCFEIIRISGGKINVSESIDKLFNKCQQVVVDEALKIHSLGISIAPYAKTLLQVEDYENDNNIKILEIILSRQVEDLMIEDDMIEGTIQSLIDNSTNNKVESLIGRLVSEKRINDMVTSYVASLSSDNINRLPVSVSKYAISTFSRDNADSYKDNTGFLILVITQGKASQKKEVIRLMKAKINDEEDIDNVINVLDNLVTEDQNILKSLIGELEVLKESEKLSADTKGRVIELTTKLLTMLDKISTHKRGLKIKIIKNRGGHQKKE